MPTSRPDIRIPHWFAFLRVLRVLCGECLNQNAKPAADARKQSVGAVAVRARKKFVHAPVWPHNSGAYVIQRMPSDAVRATRQHRRKSRKRMKRNGIHAARRSSARLLQN